MRSKSPVNIILFVLYVESCCCFTIDRESRDVSDSLDKDNCDSINQSFSESGRCRCSTESSIVSKNTGPIACVLDNNIDKSKYTSVSPYSVLFSLKNFLTMLSLLF